MKIRFISFATLFAALALILFWTQSHNEAPDSNTSDNTSTEGSQSEIEASTVSINRNQSDNSGKLPQPAGSISDSIKANSDPAGLIKNLYLTNIKYYGKILDEQDRAVENAEVFVRISNEYSYESGGRIIRLTSDESGNFSILGERGAGFYVSVSKEGYSEIERATDNILSNKKISFLRGPKKFDQSKPDLFRLRSVESLPQLIENADKFTLSKSGKVKSYPLKGSKSSLTFQLEQHKDTSSTGGGWPWIFEIRLTGGGLIKRDDHGEVAPKHGYIEVIEVDMLNANGEGRPWRKAHFQSYYIKTEDSKYGIVDVRLFAETGVMAITTRLNPDKTRNLAE